MTPVRMGLLSRSPIKIPAVHHFDVHNNFMIMRKKIVVVILSPSEDIFALTKSPKPGNIGATVGQYIALVHDWSKRNSDGILDNFKIVSIPKGLLLI